jgi:hypothetical protein
MTEFKNLTQVFKDRELRIKGKMDRKILRKEAQHKQELGSLSQGIDRVFKVSKPRSSGSDMES